MRRLERVKVKDVEEKEAVLVCDVIPRTQPYDFHSISFLSLLRILAQRYLSNLPKIIWLTSDGVKDSISNLTPKTKFLEENLIKYTNWCFKYVLKRKGLN